MTGWKSLANTPFGTLRDQLETMKNQIESIIGEDKQKLGQLQSDLKKLGG